MSNELTELPERVSETEARGVQQDATLAPFFDALYEHQMTSTLRDSCTCGAGDMDTLVDTGVAIQRHRRHLALVLRKAAIPAIQATQQRWTDWLASIGYGVDYGAIGGAEPPCSLTELAAAYVRVTGEEDAETWTWCITQETGVLTTNPTPNGDPA